MKIKLSKDTKWAEVAEVYKYFSADTVAQLKKETLKTYLGESDFYDLKIKHFIKIADGDISEFIKTPTGSLYEHIFLDELKNFICSYADTLASYQPPMTADEARASGGCVKISMGEGLLVFTRKYFNLHSFSDAQEITLAELLIAKKDNYNEIVFQRAMTKIQRQKFKK